MKTQIKLHSTNKQRNKQRNKQNNKEQTLLNNPSHYFSHANMSLKIFKNYNKKSNKALKICFFSNPACRQHK